MSDTGDAGRSIKLRRNDYFFAKKELSHFRTPALVCKNAWRMLDPGCPCPATNCRFLDPPQRRTLFDLSLRWMVTVLQAPRMQSSAAL